MPSSARRMRCFLTSRTMVIPFLHRSTGATAEEAKVYRPPPAPPVLHACRAYAQVYASPPAARTPRGRSFCAQMPKRSAENAADCTILRIIRKKGFTNVNLCGIFISVIILVTDLQGGASIAHTQKQQKAAGHPRSPRSDDRPPHRAGAVSAAQAGLSRPEPRHGVPEPEPLRRRGRRNERRRVPRAGAVRRPHGAPRTPALCAVRPRHRRAAAR